MSCPNLVLNLHRLGEHTTPATTTDFMITKSSATINAASTSASIPVDCNFLPAKSATSCAASFAASSPPSSNPTTSPLRAFNNSRFIAIVGSVSASLGSHCAVSTGRVPTRWRNSLVISAGSIESGIGNARNDEKSVTGSWSYGVNGC
ncbi:unannotated protein [freshwater metagenome]|uniref:Unannotated protein n=1 Tax=freshwater metagenome TaxID=449393 RepID=A0A6J7KXY5_9ZZZZ